jgi:hypothetical protein
MVMVYRNRIGKPHDHENQSPEKKDIELMQYEMTLTRFFTKRSSRISNRNKETFS